jgi:hypothetical protein
MSLQADIRKAIPRTTDRQTLWHLQAAEHRIGETLNPKQ